MRRNLFCHRARRIALAAGVAISAVSLPAAAAPIALTTENVAFGGEELEKAVLLPGGGKYIGLLTIANVALPTVKEARALLQGAISVRAKKGTGATVVKLRMTVNGVPEEEVWQASLTDGGAATVSFLCNAVLSASGTYTYVLQAAHTGGVNVTVDAGDFHLTALPTPQVPIP